MKSTAERVLDAAENLFAEKGFEATSLGEVADQVGIRSPSLYNHFKNKEALYLAVLDRLFRKFNQPLNELMERELTRENILSWQEKLTKLYIENPNLARLLQHAALSHSPHTQEFIKHLFMPLIEGVMSNPNGEAAIFTHQRELLPWVIMGFNNVVMGYVTMAPLYEDILGLDPFTDESADKQAAFISTLIRSVWENDDRKTLLSIQSDTESDDEGV